MARGDAKLTHEKCSFSKLSNFEKSGERPLARTGRTAYGRAQGMRFGVRGE